MFYLQPILLLLLLFCSKESLVVVQHSVGCCVLLMQTERVIHLVIAAVWQTVTLSSCFFALFLPTFAMECSMMLQAVIALDRFLHVFFPIWSLC
jgi:hypothetical protein